MKKNLWKVPLVLALLVMTSGFCAYKSDEMKNDKSNACETSCYTCSEEDFNLTAGYNAPARYEVQCPRDVFATASFIYWQPIMQGLDIATYNPSSPATNRGEVVNMEFKYKPGFKIGLGMNFDHDSWDLYAEYTSLCMSESKSKTIPSADWLNMQAAWNENARTGIYTYYAKGSWKLDSHIVDLELGRWYHVGKKLDFRPHFGLRNYYMWHKFDTTYANENSTTIFPKGNAKQRSWALGARGGVNANYLLSCGFKLFGHADCALLYQYYRTTYKKNIFSSNTDLEINRLNKIGYVTYNPEIGLGLAWGSYFCNKSWHFDMAIGYDFQAFTTQNLMRNLAVAAAEYKQDIGDMFYQGLTVTFRFDF